MIIFDTETTGLIENIAIPLKRQPQIIELFALKINDDYLRSVAGQATPVDYQDEDDGTWHSLFNARVTEEITGITGITQEMVADAPKFIQQYDSLAEFCCGERYLAGHNLPFDRDMLWLELRRIDAATRFPWPWVHLCTSEATEDKEGYRLSLTDLHQSLFGKAFEAAHRAESDVRATARSLVELIRQGKVKL